MKTGNTITNCNFTAQQSDKTIEAVQALAKAAEENAKAIAAITKLFTPEALLKIQN